MGSSQRLKGRPDAPSLSQGQMIGTFDDGVLSLERPGPRVLPRRAGFGSAPKVGQRAPHPLRLACETQAAE